MHWVLRSLLPLLRLYKDHQSICKSNPFHNSAKMASASTSATLYAAVTSPAQITGAEPEDAKELKHHLKHGKGFQNPWDSYKNTVGPTTILTIAWYGRCSFNISRPRLILFAGDISLGKADGQTQHHPQFLFTNRHSSQPVILLHYERPG